MTIQTELTSSFRSEGARPADDDVVQLADEAVTRYRNLRPTPRALVDSLVEYLHAEVDGEAFLKCREVADDLDENVKAVAAIFTLVDRPDTDVSVEKWARTNATTWRVEVDS